MAYDYLTPSWKKKSQPAEIETPNSPSTDLAQTVQANNSVQIGATAGMPNNSQVAIGNPVASGQGTVHSPARVESTAHSPARMEFNENPNQVNIGEGKQTNQVIQPVQQTVNQPTFAQPSGSSVAVRQAADYNDATVQSYWNEYQNGVNINDYQAQINALTAIDNYRATKGLKPIYTKNILELENQRTEKINNQVKDYDDEIAYAMSVGDYETAQQLGQQLQDYKKMVNYKTPTFDNAATYLQSVEYKSRWEDAINGIVQQLLTAQFTYNPSDDEALIKAQKYATSVVYESMNAKGILDSTMTAQMVTKTVNELIPVYQKMAKEEFYENIERLQTMANFIIKLDDRDYSRWNDEVTRQLQVYQAKRDEISYQWDRVNQMGYVDNEASVLLGVAPRYFVS